MQASGEWPGWTAQLWETQSSCAALSPMCCGTCNWLLPISSAVEVRLAGVGDTSIVEIRDHGPGVPEELLSQIFKPFFRVEESRDTNSGGIGLGLSIAMRAVQVHQGAITAENAKPGLKVQIVLPRLPSRKGGDAETLGKSISV